MEYRILKIFNELAKLNYSSENIEKFAGKNFLRVIKMFCNQMFYSMCFLWYVTLCNKEPVMIFTPACINF